MDKVSKEQRSRNMTAIRSTDNKTTEIEFIKCFKKNKIAGWRRHVRGVLGSPDFIFPKRKLAVFVDGCFWHGCKQHCILPKSNKKYWLPKIENNSRRDLRNRAKLRRRGWKVIRIWEHEIKKNPEKIIVKIKRMLV
ncbi:hypothetical protein A2662_03775 [Candidatus Giovannonibacteria bacterium RIFCSPHIGHO2_01_FULL_45_33]|uniref:DUF559 domain-containing protein n=1 Tax=Candidatus Giovannonibacteria bacterium RIFCSPLOWO2_01_FULL_45_34 TaxID=1798351 RepID=A0A1F5X042_9BACT|nr:MAG: hypothetical protein A2662_03775 [Candidatus Giovannonibacteria bacterium RIFCSPHIGHO2_01_FULL_45_33]OGF68816.1 MAG: hypothetical protein A3C73_02000 [Candidatus Giovannonibacteria bacterium RIFCSPHIGHO2_02_FULL_44_11]OGF81223.1 MAG: hypothetical protein A2930_02040 [Candidatus Giovannonibacteria bacterium RIFCSPLOWO2_01_FULL_45_34]